MSCMATINETTAPPFSNDEERWAAVARRDRHADGIFYYSVQTTGVYCRPSCAARRVRDALSRTDTVTEAIYDAGFNSNGRFYATSLEVLGMTPTNFRSGGTGTSIRFAVGACSLGSILVAATGKGVCAILLGDD